jgi:cell division protein FtsQ
MDLQGRFAQPLTRPDWLEASGRARRFKRFVRRRIAPLLDLDIPRGAGSIAAAMVVAASIGYGIAAGHHGPEIAAELHRACDRVSDSAGFRVTSVALSGEHQLTRNQVLAAAGVGDESSLLCLDAATARRDLMSNPWIADATVLKLYPGRLHISITERKPLALWQKDGRVAVISDDGTVLEDFTGNRFRKLPLVVGDGAAKQARGFLAMLDRYPAIRGAMNAAVLVADRRWNVRLDSGVDIKLPDSGVDRALQTLVDLDRDKKLLSRDITVVDLRLPDRVTVRLSDDAAAARAEAMKNLLKKPKKKGNEA